MTHAASFPFPPREPIDAGRIAANTGTLLVNAALILLLLIPLTAHVVREPPAREEGPIIYEPVKPKPIKPPEHVEIRQRPPTPTSQPSLHPQPIARNETPVVDPQPGDIAIEPAQIAVDEGATLDPMPPAAAAQLQALNSPPPPYPGQAMRDGLTGVVELEILVGIDGRPLDVRIVRSSGHRVLDQAASRTVLKRWTFQPAMRDGQPVQALGRVPIEFSLQ
ncbi:energy transducer TonB [Lysobacter panacisoli]|uniref:Protein TonB n=1 Tax=Lysobacter panacisoli TaxID=1255263 RepID=A0ABP9LED9_9GAMM|nr:energy transducer TonB [Lysobacter panacisoli]